MRFGSVCSGIEAASVAWHPLGWKAAWLSEIEPFPSAVLAHHYPDVPNLGDMTTISRRVLTGEVSAPDVFCGGTPCQSFSAAGLRQSLDDARGNLSIVFCEIANAIDTVRTERGEQPAIIFWENVPGVLSTKDNAFGCFLAGLAGEDQPLEPPGGRWTNAGYVSGPKRAAAWRVLDAQYFGLAQRRRRVFVVASARNDFDPTEVLFEFGGVRRDTAPRREAREAAPCGLARSTGGCGIDGSVMAMAHGQGRAEIAHDRSPTLTCNHEAPIAVYTGQASIAIDFAENSRAELRLEGGDGQRTGTLNTGGGKPGQGIPCIAYTTKLHNTGSNNAGKSFEERTTFLDANSPPPVVFQPTGVFFAGQGAKAGSIAYSEDVAPTLKASDSGTNRTPSAHIGMSVRRLTPVECERLQGFPTVLETVKIQACIDHQNSVVRAAIQCRRLQNNAWSADESESLPNVKTAAASLSTHQADREPLAALHVRMHSVDELLEVRSLGRSIWSASGAAASNKSLPPTLNENTVQELARLLREVAHSVRSGKAASPLNISLSFPASFGATSAEKFGPETAGNVSDATKDQNKVTFTTSDLGLITTSSDSTAETLCCSALHAIAGCIPETTLPETFSIELTVETPYTAIPWRKKSADQCPDGPRYKAIGNSWAVPVVRWIGQRIQKAINN